MNCQPCGVIVHLVFGLQVHGRRVSTVSCRGGAVDGGEGQPGPELEGEH